MVPNLPTAQECPLIITKITFDFDIKYGVKVEACPLHKRPGGSLHKKYS